MVVLILERVPVALRGQLTRWLIEPRAGTFVGRVSSRVREHLWGRVCRSAMGGAATLIYQTNNEQGFGIQTLGEGRREVVDVEGLWLIRWPREHS